MEKYSYETTALASSSSCAATTKGNLELRFQRTILGFKNRLEPKELVEIQCNSLAELNEVIIHIQRRQRDQKQMMNLNRIKSFLEAMDQFEQTIKVFVNTSNIVAFIWSPIKLLLSVRACECKRDGGSPADGVPGCQYVG